MSKRMRRMAAAAGFSLALLGAAPVLATDLGMRPKVPNLPPDRLLIAPDAGDLDRLDQTRLDVEDWYESVSNWATHRA